MAIQPVFIEHERKGALSKVAHKFRLRNSSLLKRSMYMLILFSIGVISWSSLPILRNESTSHRRKIEVNRLWGDDRLDKRPLIW